MFVDFFPPVGHFKRERKSKKEKERKSLGLEKEGRKEGRKEGNS